MKEILRSHTKEVEGKQFIKHSIDSVCMHGGFFFGDHTTGSYIASLNNSLDTHWVTGSSTPCVSIFKPFWFIEDEGLSFSDNQEEKAIEYWKLRERLNRMILENRISNLLSYLLKRDELENKMQEKVGKLDMDDIDKEKLLDLMNNFSKEESQLVKKTIQDNESNMGVIKGNPYFRWYWKKQNERLFKKN